MKLIRSVTGTNRTKVLLALLHTHALHGHAHLGSVADAAGLSRTTTWQHLKALRDLELVDWTEGQAGTLHPLVHEVPEWLADS